MQTILVYKIGSTNYRKTFAHQVSYGTIEQFLIMEKHIGVSQHQEVIVEIQNLLT
jgi:hypothetical protein